MGQLPAHDSDASDDEDGFSGDDWEEFLHTVWGLILHKEYSMLPALTQHQRNKALALHKCLYKFSLPKLEVFFKSRYMQLLFAVYLRRNREGALNHKTMAKARSDYELGLDIVYRQFISVSIKEIVNGEKSAHADQSADYL